MIPIEARLAIADLFADYGACLDGDRLEDWLDCFVEGCEYRIVSRENLRQGLPLALMLCENKDMLRDRVVSLREANEYSVHTDKHVIGGVRITGPVDGGYAVEAGYAMFQADAEGTGSLYSFGTYVAECELAAGAAKFRRLTVVVDNWNIPHMLSTPI